MCGSVTSFCDSIPRLVHVRTESGEMADVEEAKVPEEQPVEQENVEADVKQETEPAVEAPTKTEPDEAPSETNNGEGETTQNNQNQEEPDASAGGDAVEEAKAEDEDDEDDR